MPPIPAEFANRLSPCGEICFATRSINPFKMYDFNEYLFEALMGEAPDYLAFGHAGHGVNSYAFTYQLVNGSLVLVAQTLWGGVYTGEKETQWLREQLHRCFMLIDAVRGCTLDQTRGRLMVFESSFRDSAWGWLRQPLATKRQARTWIDQHAVRIGPDAPDEGLPTNLARQSL